MNLVARFEVFTPVKLEVLVRLGKIVSEGSAASILNGLQP
jgi:hypothetical protein